jgi:hypothetical protein
MFRYHWKEIITLSVILEDVYLTATYTFDRLPICLCFLVSLQTLVRNRQWGLPGVWAGLTVFQFFRVTVFGLRVNHILNKKKASIRSTINSTTPEAESEPAVVVPIPHSHSMSEESLQSQPEAESWIDADTLFSVSNQISESEWDMRYTRRWNMLVIRRALEMYVNLPGIATGYQISQMYHNWFFVLQCTVCKYRQS